jgi:hypothetical protein
MQGCDFVQTHALFLRIIFFVVDLRSRRVV